ncbi:DoxX family protein [Andreprevotia chitinilytica]|uniref:DoxX family protein n=1 Tax=Andreprevotia chitinilytica TaxID=396808 RepID=UPI000551E2A8|nr:DoxX family protein [Andreprevotia chitinilytica]
MKYLCMLQRLYALFETLAAKLQPLFALAARIYVARAFFLSGLTKIRDWDATLWLFSNEYHVPVLPPPIAAVFGAGGELFFPVLLVLGLAGRFGAVGLFFVNVMAVISYPGLEPIAIKDHVLWGVLLGYLVVHGTGLWSVDTWLLGRLRSQCAAKA